MEPEPIVNRAGYFPTLNFCSVYRRKMTMGSSLNSEPIVIKQFHPNEKAEKVGKPIVIKEFEPKKGVDKG